MIGLRDYQQDIYIKAREALKKHRVLCIQLATGGGKTPIEASMCSSVHDKEKFAWLIGTRIEIMDSMSRHLLRYGVPHNHIKPNREESNAFNIHVVSSDTLIRRFDKIKNWPNLIGFDEAHLNLDRQIKIIKIMDEWLIKNGKNPFDYKIIGFTATPERYDGRGLWKGAGGIYDVLIEGPPIPWLMENDYLSQLRYFAPPIDGIFNLKRKGYDYDAIELDEFLKHKKIYGELVGHYEKHGKNKPALIFCRSVKSAYHTAERFREKGFKFYCIEGKLTDKRRRDLIQALTDGTIDGLTNCELAIYGLDIPRIEYGASIRPTLSRSLYFQMIGRELRPYTEYHMKYDYKNGIYVHDLDNIKYKKEEALFFDHVNLVLEHQEPDYPGVPPHYVPYINWNFKGREKRKIKKSETNIKLCPYLDFMYCEKPHCQSCRHNPDKSKSDCRRDMIIVPADLVEKSKPIPIKDRPFEEQREIQDKIGSAVIDYKNTENPNAVKMLLDLAKKLGYKHAWKWVYYKLTFEDRYTRNIPVLHEIARQEGYHPWWVKHALKALGDKKRRG